MQQLLSSLRALGDETRLRIASVLHAGSFNVNELVGILGMGQSRVSRHLRILLDAGLVQARREGTWVYYLLSERWQGEGPDGDRLLAELATQLVDALVAERAAIDACFAARRDKAEQFFSDVAAGWDQRRDEIQGPPEYLDRLIGFVGHPGTAVDLGTGTGVLLSRLSPRADRVIGIDASADMLKVARENVHSWGLGNVEFRLGAVEHLPLPDGEADTMVANMVLHHVVQPGQALKEVCRSLASNGRLLVADFSSHENEEYREKLGDLWLGFENEEFEGWLKSADLEIQKYEHLPAEKDRPAIFLAVAGKRC